mmetsp:Transcript_5173/g.14834  ORF Transcript_5173/g.14834 Transcript_5173/m.14834 type:complete len:272 (+) Transcript_5173:558-1373(+)
MSSEKSRPLMKPPSRNSSTKRSSVYSAGMLYMMTDVGPCWKHCPGDHRLGGAAMLMPTFFGSNSWIDSNAMGPKCGEPFEQFDSRGVLWLEPSELPLTVGVSSSMSVGEERTASCPASASYSVPPHPVMRSLMGSDIFKLLIIVSPACSNKMSRTFAGSGNIRLLFAFIPRLVGTLAGSDICRPSALISIIVCTLTGSDICLPSAWRSMLSVNATDSLDWRPHSIALLPAYADGHAAPWRPGGYEHDDAWQPSMAARVSFENMGISEPIVG